MKYLLVEENLGSYFALTLIKRSVVRKWFEPRNDIPRVTYLQSLEGLLFATDVSTTCAEAIIRVNSCDHFQSLESSKTLVSDLIG